MPKATSPPSTTARNTDINGIKLSNDETEETENQVYCHIQKKKSDGKCSVMLAQIALLYFIEGVISTVSELRQ